MNTDLHELELVLKSRFPIVVIESHEESSVLALFRKVVPHLNKVVMSWSATEGLVWNVAPSKLELDGGAGYSPVKHKEPEEVLEHIKTQRQPGVFILKDFHPYLNKPINVRLLREIAMDHDASRHTIVLVSPRIELPKELQRLSAKFSLSLPGRDALRSLVEKEARMWGEEKRGNVRADKQALEQLVNNLQGLTAEDASRLARSAIWDDGAITHSDVAEIQQAKYKLDWNHPKVFCYWVCRVVARVWPLKQLPAVGAYRYCGSTSVCSTTNILVRPSATCVNRSIWLSQCRPVFCGLMRLRRGWRPTRTTMVRREECWERYSPGWRSERTVFFWWLPLTTSQRCRLS
jgi:hypothetical protein